MRAATFVKIGIVAVGLAAFIGLIAANIPKPQAQLWIMAIVLPEVFLLYTVGWVDSKRRRSELSEWLGRRGFDVIPPPQLDDHPDAELLLDLKNLKGFPRLHLAAVGRINGLKLHIAEYSLARGGGELACFQATVPCPAGWPRLAL